MSDNTKVLDRNPVLPSVSGNVVSPQGSLNKEQAPVGSDLSEFIKPAGPEVSPSVPQEVSDSGVQVKTDKPDLTFEHKQIGIEPAGQHISVPSGPTGLVQIPQIKDIGSSATWLNALINKIQKVMRLMGI